MTTLHLIDSLKQHGQDYEFYPTTHVILASLIRDLQRIVDPEVRAAFERHHRRPLRPREGKGRE